MPAVFSRIVGGELPARFVWKDGRWVAVLSNRPLRSGHTLVVPRQEVDHWPERVGLAQHEAVGDAAFRPPEAPSEEVCAISRRNSILTGNWGEC